jgi:hypothetical protein
LKFTEIERFEFEDRSINPYTGKFDYYPDSKIATNGITIESQENCSAIGPARSKLHLDDLAAFLTTLTDGYVLKTQQLQ